jgi:hypothetical protein
VTRAEWIARVRAALADAGHLLDAPPDDATPPGPDAERASRIAPDDPDPEEERHAVARAWRSMLDAEPDVALDGCPLVATLFTAVACSYEGAEDDRPAVGVLMAIRETVAAWSRSNGESTVFASVAYADLALLARRVDVVIALVRDDAARGGAR